MNKINKCPECEHERFGLDQKGHFCYNCGHALPDKTQVPQEAVIDCREGGPVVHTQTLEEDQPQGVEDMKRTRKGAAPKKTTPKNRAAAKARPKKATKKPAKKAPVKKDGPKPGTSEYYALYGKKDGEPKLANEKRGEAIGKFLNGLLLKNLEHQRKGAWKRMLTNLQIAEKFMTKYPGRNFQSISSYISYFNRAFGGLGNGEVIAGSDDALRARSYWERQDRIEKETAAKAKRKK